jgi:DHA2 family multidrug resistance protein-like MFS transporter
MADAAVDGSFAASVASNTLADAVAVARHLPASIGAGLIENAQDAFIQAFQFTAGLCALVALAAAILAAVLCAA